MNVPALQRSLPDIVAEYDAKKAAIVDAEAAFERAGNALKMACTIGGTYGREQIDVGRTYQRSLFKNLLTSAWLHVYDGLNIKTIASPRDVSRFEQSMADPPPFTLDNIRATFGDYILNPRANILRGLAEVFCDLDPAFKSHEKMKIGVAGLPKRVVLRGFGQFSSYGSEGVKTILNALAALQGKPLVDHHEINALMNEENALRHAGELPLVRYEKEVRTTPGRGVWLRRFMNGNGHLFFASETLRDVNRGLAEFYGDVLPDTTSDGNPPPKRPGREVSKDLQFYPTPAAVVEHLVGDLGNVDGKTFLEPSCGEGSIMVALKAKGARVMGIEVDAGRAATCRAKGLNVTRANFLDCAPPAVLFDGVVMNPPFYGRHYAKHVRHAMTFLKPGGVLTAVLPVTARHDHGLLDDLNGRWWDLPVGSFSASGTNINTVTFTARRPK